MPTIIPRDTLRDFLSHHAAPGATFPTGARMQAAGAAHGEADVLDCGYDYESRDVAHSIAEWVSLRDARAYLLGYEQGQETAAMEMERREMRRLAGEALAALTAAESAAYMASPLFDHGGAWNDSPLGSTMIRAESALRAILAPADYGDVAAHALSKEQDAYVRDVKRNAAA